MKSPVNTQSVEFIERLKKGDSRTFSQLFDHYASLFKGICYRYTHDHERSDDIIQEAFIKIFRNISSYNGKGNFEGWLKRIVVNTCLDYVRKEQRIILDQGTAEYEVEKNIGRWEVPISNMTMQEIAEVIGRLPEGLRTVFNLNTFDGYSHREIGEKLGISESASRGQLAKAKAKLKEEIKGLNIYSASA